MIAKMRKQTISAGSNVLARSESFQNVASEGYREFRQMGGFGGMLENDPTATRLVLMDSYGIGHTISVVRPIIGPMLRPLCSKNT